MNCKKCNSPLQEGINFCPNCGEKVVSNVETDNNTVVEEQVADAASTVSQTLEKKKSKAPLIIGIIVGSLVLLSLIIVLAVIFVIPALMYSNNPKSGSKPIVEPVKEKTVDISGYTFTLPEGFSILEPQGVKVVGSENFYFVLEKASTSTSSYEDLVSTKYYMATTIANSLKDMNYISSTEETYDGQKYLVFSFSYTQNGGTYYYDVIYTKLPDDVVFMTGVDYVSSYKKTGYESLTKFIKSAKSKSVTTPTTSDDYTLAGDSTLGYVKLPGEWTKTKIAGSDDKPLQYAEKKTYTGSTATGSWLVTLNVLDKSYTTSAKSAADNEANYYKTYDSDATNIKVESARMGKYNAYKLYCQYKSDKVWVVTWYFEAEDGLVHVIQVEGLDLTKDYFKIPETFSLTK